jgi:hypothetical protein
MTCVVKSQIKLDERHFDFTTEYTLKGFLLKLIKIKNERTHRLINRSKNKILLDLIEKANYTPKKKSVQRALYFSRSVERSASFFPRLFLLLLLLQDTYKWLF